MLREYLNLYIDGEIVYRYTGSMLNAKGIQGETNPFSSEICTFFCTCHNFFPLSSVQIIIIPSCCLLCVL